MAGKKGRSGGARTPRDPATAKKRGPLIRRVALEKDAAHEIKVLLLAAGREYTAENVAAQIAIWSRQAWEDYEAGIAPDLEAEGYILCRQGDAARVCRRLGRRAAAGAGPLRGRGGWRRDRDRRAD